MAFSQASAIRPAGEGRFEIDVSPREGDPGPAGADRSEFLVDRSVDPKEDVNLVARESAAAQRMRELLDAHLADEPAPDVLREDIRIDPEIERRLRAMGYLQDQ